MKWHNIFATKLVGSKLFYYSNLIEFQFLIDSSAFQTTLSNILQFPIFVRMKRNEGSRSYQGVEKFQSTVWLPSSLSSLKEIENYFIFRSKNVNLIHKLP